MEVAVKEQRQQKALSVFSFWKYKKCFPHLEFHIWMTSLNIFKTGQLDYRHC